MKSSAEEVVLLDVMIGSEELIVLGLILVVAIVVMIEVEGGKVVIVTGTDDEVCNAVSITPVGICGTFKSDDCAQQKIEMVMNERKRFTAAIREFGCCDKVWFLDVVIKFGFCLRNTKMAVMTSPLTLAGRLKASIKYSIPTKCFSTKPILDDQVISTWIESVKSKIQIENDIVNPSLIHLFNQTVNPNTSLESNLDFNASNEIDPGMT